MNIEITDKEIRLLNLMIQSYWVENNNAHEDNHEDWILTNELVKKLSQNDVSNRREQLIAFADAINICDGHKEKIRKLVDLYLKSN